MYLELWGVGVHCSPCETFSDQKTAFRDYGRRETVWVVGDARR